VNARLIVATLFFGAFVANMNNFALGPFLAPIAADIGSTVPRIGQAATAAMIIGAIVGLILGPLSDQYGLRRLVLIGTLLMAASGVGTALAFDYWSLVLTRIPAGIAAGLIFGLGISLVTTRLPESERRSAIAWVAGAGALAAIFGVPLMAFLGELSSWRVGFWLIGLIGVLMTLLYLRTIAPDPPVSSEPFRPLRVFSVYRAVLSSNVLTLLLIGNLFWALGWIGFVTYVGAYTMDAVGASLNGVGLIYSAGGVFFFAGNRSATYLLRFTALRTLMNGCAILLAAGLVLVFTFAPTWALLITLVSATAFVGGIGLPTITILIAESTSAAPGTVMMLRQFTWGAGSGLGAATGGVAIAIGGYVAVGAVFALCALLAALPIWLPIRKSSQPAHVQVGQPGS
jgi:MFS transporter, DHA1 family, inner membrane transport protein